MLDPLALFASGDVMLDTSGNVILDASGNVLLDDGTGCASCCVSCKCDSTGASAYGGTFLCTFSGVTVPLGGPPCIIGTTTGFSSGTARFTSCILNSGTTICLPYMSMVTPTTCDYSVDDTGSGAASAVWDDCAPIPTSSNGLLYSVQTSWVSGSAALASVVVELRGLVGLPIFALGFDSDNFVIPCGGSITVSNVATYRFQGSGVNHNFGGSVTITDTSC